MMEWREWLSQLAPGGYEAILTIRLDGRDNASAVGVEWDGHFFSIRLFHGSDTYAGVCLSEHFGLCFFPPDNILPILKAALLGYGSEEEEFGPEEYTGIEGEPGGSVGEIGGGEAGAMEGVRGEMEEMGDGTLERTPVLSSSPARMVCAVVGRERGVVDDEVGETAILAIKARPEAGEATEIFVPPGIGCHPVLVAASAATRAMFLYARGDKGQASSWKDRANVILEKLEGCEVEKNILQEAMARMG